MTDADLQIAIKGVLDVGLAAQSIAVTVVQGENPTTQGAPLPSTVAFKRIGGHRYGWQGRKRVWNSGAGLYDKVETQYLEATFQLSTLINQDASDVASLNSYDVADACAMILQTEETLATFRALAIGMRRITDIRMLYSLDDSERHNADASFDFTLTYRNTLSSTPPGAEAVTGTFERV